MANVTLTISSAPVPSGTSHIPPAGISCPSGFTSCQVAIDTTAYQSTDQITVEAEWSQDGGTTWTFGGGITTDGGPHVDRTGATVLAGFAAPIPQVASLKGRAIVSVPSAGTLSGSITLVP